MLRLLDLRKGVSHADTSAYRGLVPRAEVDVEKALEAVRPICAAVAAEGEAALRRFSREFDGVEPTALRIPAEELARRAAELPPALRSAFDEAIRRRRLVAEREADLASIPASLGPGASVATRSLAVDRVGLYVPGGLAPLASSVIHNVVPAQVAGVPSIAVASPPQSEFGGLPHPNVMGLCHLLGVTELYAVGGAQAIAMFAYGVPGLCEPVDLVTGPGNIYVVAAKRLLKGRVAIDAEAGPTEIAILADSSADPRHVAADLLSQAEHDPLAAAVLVTDSPTLVAEVQAQLAAQLQTAAHRDRMTRALTGEQSAIVLVHDMDQGLAVVDAYAAEHLEIQTRDAADLALRVRHAGAIFVGPYSPVSLGDYVAGSTHVLPTAGSARHSSGLTVRTFLRTVHVIEYTRAGLLGIADEVEAFARAEDLPGHANAVTLRRER